MKLLGVRLARSIWLAPQQFMNPRGVFLRQASLEIKARYQFLKTPFENATVGTAEPKYEHGGFKTKRGTEIQITSVIAHSDGVVVDTTSTTDDGDAFLEDIFDWLGRFGIPAPSALPIKRIYASELNVALDRPPAFLNPKLMPFVEELASLMSDDKKGPVGFLGFQLTTDPERSPRPSQFRFEREINTSIDDNRYYSFAPIKTADHIRLLEKLDASI